MKRIIENTESLEVVRQKCITRQVDFKDDELAHLNLVFIELQKSYGKKHVKPLDRSCSYCIITAMNSVHNYLAQEGFEKKSEQIVEEIIEEHKIEAPVIVDCAPSEIEIPLNETVKIISDDKGVRLADELSLPELRTKYPHIKARSKERFLELLNESK